MKKSAWKQSNLRHIAEILWRTASACGLFLIFYLVKLISYYAMCTNPFLKNVAGFWSNSLFCRTVFVLSTVLYFSLVSVLTIHDERYQKRYLHMESDKSTFRNKCRLILCGTEFWIETAVIAIWVVVSSSKVFFFDLISGFFPDAIPLEAYGLTVAIMLPLLFFITFLAHLSTVNWWLKQERKKAQPYTVRERVTAFVKQLLFTCIIYISTAFALTVIYPILTTFGKVLNFHPLVFIIPICTVLIGLLFFRYARALLTRKRFFAQLRKICREEHYELSNCNRLYSSVFSPKPGINFEITANGTVYSCKLLCSLRRKTPLCLDEEGNAKYTVSYGLFGYDFFTDTISFDYFFDSKWKKLLIIDPAVLHIYATKDTARRRLESGDRIMGYLLYDGMGFLNALKRKCL